MPKKLLNREPESISVAEAAEVLNLSMTAIREGKAETGNLRRYNQGRRVFLIRAEVYALRDSKIRQAVAPNDAVERIFQNR
jgi:hypothetical protein